MKKVMIPGRIAIRREGHMVNAYFASMDTMERAVWLGSIPVIFADNKELFKRFKQLMIDGAGSVIQDITKGRIERWTEQPAPEHERTRDE